MTAPITSASQYSFASTPTEVSTASRNRAASCAPADLHAAARMRSDAGAAGREHRTLDEAG